MNQSRLFIVDGVSSVWKKDLVYFVNHMVAGGTVIRKCTTRTLRVDEESSLLDLDVVDEGTFRLICPDYQYEHGGHKYGVRKTTILSALKANSVVFVIVRNSGVISQMKRDFCSYSPVTVFVHMDMALAWNRGLAGRSVDTKAAVKSAFLDYLREPSCYERIVINGGSQNDFFRLISLLINESRPLLSIFSDESAAWKLTLISTRNIRRLAQAILGMVSATAMGFAVNLSTSSLDSQWKLLSLILNIVILALGAVGQFIIYARWRELPPR